MREFSIGQLANATGVKVPTIRYYEDIGLMDPASRTEGGQRRYPSHARDRLRFIAHARDMRFSLEATRSLIDLADHPEKPCHGADRIAAERLREVEVRIARLTRLKRELERMLEGHVSGRAGECRIIEVLGDHVLCEAEH
jgi:DNA-binding transcriptional MerR regulator